MPHLSDQELIEHTHNTSRFFVEHRQIAWAALVAAVAWGAYGYFSMPQRKDPDIPVRVAVASCRWPGATAQEVEQLVTRPIEQTIAENKHIHPATPDEYGIRSISLPGISIVYVQLAENVNDTREQFSDINLRLHALTPKLPSGATGIQFQSDFSDTAALMMTVASPPIDDLEIQMRSRSVEDAIRSARAEAGPSKSPRISIVFTFPLTLSKTGVAEATEAMRLDAERAGVLRRSRLITGRGFMAIDGETDLNDECIEAYVRSFAQDAPARIRIRSRRVVSGRSFTTPRKRSRNWRRLRPRNIPTRSLTISRTSSAARCSARRRLRGSNAKASCRKPFTSIIRRNGWRPTVCSPPI